MKLLVGFGRKCKALMDDANCRPLLVAYRVPIMLDWARRERGRAFNGTPARRLIIVGYGGRVSEMSGDAVSLADDVLCEICKLDSSDEGFGELMADLRAVVTLVAQRHKEVYAMQHAVALLTGALGRSPTHYLTHLPFGYDGPRSQLVGWIKRETLETAAKQIFGLIWPKTSPRTVADAVRFAVLNATKLGFLEEKEYDAWQPGMASGSGWTTAISATTYGMEKARSLALSCGRADVRPAGQEAPSPSPSKGEQPSPPIASPHSPGFYIYVSSQKSPTLAPESVFFRTDNEEVARALCRLCMRAFSAGEETVAFFMKPSSEVSLDEQLLLDEALDHLRMYDDPDRFVYDPPPDEGTICRAQYAIRADGWERHLLERLGTQPRSDRQVPDDAGGTAVPIEHLDLPVVDGQVSAGVGGVFGISPDQSRNAALTLLMLLAQAYYKLLESAVSMASWATTLDLELNDSYLWTTQNLANLLKNHEALRDFPEPFTPLFQDLYPSTIRDCEWEDMVGPDADRFLSTVQQYVHSKGFVAPQKGSEAWIFVELFRPSIMTAIERAAKYEAKIREYVKKLRSATHAATQAAPPATPASPPAADANEAARASQGTPPSRPYVIDESAFRVTMGDKTL